MTSLADFLAANIGKPAPGLTLRKWCQRLATKYIEELEAHMNTTRPHESPHFMRGWITAKNELLGVLEGAIET